MPIRRSPALSRAYLTIVKVPLIGGKRKESLRLSIRDIYRARAHAHARARIIAFIASDFPATAESGKK
jgi:hypothetical protein